MSESYVVGAVADGCYSVFAYEPGLRDTHIGDFIWRTYIPRAIASGKLKAKPDSMIID